MSQPLSSQSDISDPNKDEYEGLKLSLEVWKKVIDVQQHFNDLEMRIRGLAVTVLTTILGATGLALGGSGSIHVFGVNVKTGVVFVLAGIIAWLAFYGMDRWWYHRLLQGAVDQAKVIEKELEGKIVGIGLSHSISKKSPVPIYRKRSLHSETKIDLFYGLILVLLIIVLIVILVQSTPTTVVYY